jgi:hypothetical protein
VPSGILLAYLAMVKDHSSRLIERYPGNKKGRSRGDIFPSLPLLPAKRKEM